MNKILPFIFVFLFWSLYYIGKTNERTGELIAIVVSLFGLLCLLLCIKGWIKKLVNNIG